VALQVAVGLCCFAFLSFQAAALDLAFPLFRADLIVRTGVIGGALVLTMKRATDLSFGADAVSGAALLTLSLGANVAKFAVVVRLAKCRLGTCSRERRTLLEGDALD